MRLGRVVRGHEATRHNARRGPDRAKRRGGSFAHSAAYVDLLPPCNHACPAGENIQAWLALAQAGEYDQAWKALVADNPARRCTVESATTRARAPGIATPSMPR